MNILEELSFPSFDHYSKLDCSAYLKAAANLGFPLVEVGSGDARAMKWLMTVNPKVEAYCVDPNPKSYTNNEPSIEPCAATVDDLIEKNPDLVQNCVLVLIRPTPSLRYDIDAIRLLRPRGIFAMISIDGSDGSDRMQYFANDQGCPTFGGAQKDNWDNYADEIPRYKSVWTRFATEIPSNIKVKVPTCVLFVRPNMNLPELQSGEQNKEWEGGDERISKLVWESTFSFVDTLQGRLIGETFMKMKNSGMSDAEMKAFFDSGMFGMLATLFPNKNLSK